MTFLLSTIYLSALVIISLPTPTFHCLFTLCLPDFLRHFSVLVVREAQKAKDSGILTNFVITKSRLTQKSYVRNMQNCRLFLVFVWSSYD